MNLLHICGRFLILNLEVMNTMQQNNNYRDSFVKAITELCLQNGEFFDECEYAEQRLAREIPPDFNPLKYFKFEPIYNFEVGGNGDYITTHHYTHNPLFANNGFMLDFTETKMTSTISYVSEGYELWLLDNLKLVVVYSCEMRVTQGGIIELATYRHRVKDGLYQFRLDFDPEYFADLVIDKVLDAMYGEERKNLFDDLSST